MAPDVTILADAGPQAGLGHVSRCGALAVALGVRGLEVACYVERGEPLERDGVRWAALRDASALASGRVLVVDSYRVSGEQAAGWAAGRPLVRFHDHGALPQAALVISPGSDGGGDGVLGGLRHACLRPAYWGAPQRRVDGDVGGVLVSAGASAGSGAAALAAAVRDAVPAAVPVRLVAGPYSDEPVPDGVEPVRAPGSLAGHLQQAGLVVTAAGQTLLEALCLGTPAVGLALVDNQRPQLELAAAAGAVRPATPDSLRETVAALVRSGDERADLAARGQALVDGYGALRVAWRVAGL